MRLDDVYTKLWDYGKTCGGHRGQCSGADAGCGFVLAEKDIAVHQVRALAQLGCMLTLIGYSLSFFADNKDEEPVKEKDRTEAAIIYYQHSASMPPGRKSRRGSTRRSKSTSSSVSEPSKHSSMP